MPVRRTRRPAAPRWADQHVTMALGTVEHRSPTITTPMLGEVSLARLDVRGASGTWAVGMVRVVTTGSGSDPAKQMSEADALDLADQHREAATALAGLVGVVRRVPVQTAAEAA